MPASKLYGDFTALVNYVGAVKIRTDLSFSLCVCGGVFPLAPMTQPVEYPVMATIGHRRPSTIKGPHKDSRQQLNTELMCHLARLLLMSPTPPSVSPTRLI